MFLLIALILPVTVLEILAKTVFAEPPSLFIPSNDFRLIYELSPHYPQINSFGMRQEEFDPSTLRNQFVIAVIRSIWILSLFFCFHGLDIRDYGYDPADTSTHFSDKGFDLIGKAFANSNFTLSRRVRSETSRGQLMETEIRRGDP
jgi:hypothetical protein